MSFRLRMQTVTRAEIAENIRLIMGIRGMTQEALGTALGASKSARSYASQLVHPPYSRLSEAAVDRIAEVLNVPPAWLRDPELSKRTVDELKGVPPSD